MKASKKNPLAAAVSNVVNIRDAKIPANDSMERIGRDDAMHDGDIIARIIAQITRTPTMADNLAARDKFVAGRVPVTVAFYARQNRHTVTIGEGDALGIRKAAIAAAIDKRAIDGADVEACQHVAAAAVAAETDARTLALRTEKAAAAGIARWSKICEGEITLPQSKNNPDTAAGKAGKAAKDKSGNKPERKPRAKSEWQSMASAIKTVIDKMAKDKDVRLPALLKYFDAACGFASKEMGKDSRAAKKAARAAAKEAATG